MAWTIEFLPDAAKELKKLGHAEAGRIIRTLEDRIAAQNDPRSLGRPLTGDLDGYWRWRIGNYRVIARIEDTRLVILVLRVAHRREAYR